MIPWIDALLVILVLTGFLLLGSSRLNEGIRVVAIQGFALGFLPLLVHHTEISFRLFVLAVGSMSIKGLVFPRLLSRAVREAHVRREIEPYIGFTLSLLMGILLLFFSFWLSSRLVLPDVPPSPLIVPSAVFLALVGFFIIVSRKTALSQVLGYIILENGLFVFGVALAQEQPYIVELGVLLDVFVGVFVMGIMIFHINREFDHIDTNRLADLKDTEL